jgi:hypothetical protein
VYCRDLEDTVEITVTNSPIPITHFMTGQCLFGILGKFSEDIYVDPYEILHERELREYIRVLNNWTDLENPAWLAKSNSTVFIQLQPVLTGESRISLCSLTPDLTFVCSCALHR